MSGRCLSFVDVGCGTGPNVIFLATHGWRATSVDFSAAVIRSACRAADGVTGASFLQGDVTKLTQLPTDAPIDLVRDMGCYHSLPDDAEPTSPAAVACGRVKLAAPPGRKIDMSWRQTLFDTQYRLGPGLRQLSL